jgi:extracellular elastinolytic metalloproteinase
VGRNSLSSVRFAWGDPGRLIKLYRIRYWAVVEEHGYSPLWFGHPKPKGKKTKKPSDHFGNRMLLQNIIDGMKLQPCYPTFVDARDAILLADKLNYNGISTCAMWKAFASRGMGANAVSGGREDFTLPAQCETA